MTFFCQFCSFCCPTWRMILRHTFEAHSSQPNFSFTCGVEGCPQTFTKYSTILSHLSRKHRGVNVDAAGSSMLPTEQFDSAAYPSSPAHGMTLDEGLAPPSAEHQRSGGGESLQGSAALFLLTLKERYQLTQTAVDFSISQVQQMVTYATEDIKCAVESALQAHSLATGMEMPDVSSCFENINPFDGLQSEYMQTKFYRENFDLVEPVSIQLGSSVQSRARGTLCEQKDTFQYVPFRKGLTALLKNQEICDEVFRSHSRSDGFIADYCDGSLFKSHSLYQNFPDALQIVLYFDELEVCNPLAGHAGVHKLGMFYYMLGNLRSTQRSIQLIACVTSVNLGTYGFTAVLQPFIDDVNNLCKNGITLPLNGMEIQLRGTVLSALADTLAAHQLGGFKIGVGFALRKCRDCMATRNDIQCKFVEDDFHRRNSASYDYQCTLLDGPLASEDSVTYGINYRSPLNQIEYFHVANGQLPQDVMHILFEGVLPMEIKLMLREFIYEEKYFCLDTLNARVRNFTYGRTEARSKPPKAFGPAHLTGNTKLPLSATQMWTFATLLPLFIGDKVPEEDPLWECYLLLLQITKQCTACVTSPASSATIAALVDQHHREFRNCYPNVTLTPKHHYMVHFPAQLLRIGPLITCWCMRMEAKNSYFKKVARISNFKNVAYSVAKRHQRLICAYLQGKFFTYNELQCGRCKASGIVPLHEDPLQNEILNVLPDTNPETMVSRPNWIKIFGEEYHHSEYLLCDWQADDLPFGKIKDILVVVGSPLFSVELFKTVGINNHLQCYAISRTHRLSLLNASQLVDPHPLCAHTCIDDGRQYIAMRAHVVNTSLL